MEGNMNEAEKGEKRRKRKIHVVQDFYHKILDKIG